MDFAIFNKTEMDEMFQVMTEHMPEEIKTKKCELKQKMPKKYALKEN